MDLVDELLALAKLFEEEQVSYAVCGGLAVTIHGRPRLTVDIDLVIPKPAMDDAIQIASRAGFDMKNGWVSLPENNLGIDRLYRLTKIDGDEFLTLDLLEVDSQNNRVFVNRESVRLGDESVTVLSIVSIIEMKSGSSRTKDHLDIEMLQDESQGG